MLLITDSNDAHNSEVFVTGHIENDQIIEASGLARSNHHNDIVWTMNDKGPPALYAIGTNGSQYGSVTILNASNIDWEDLAAFELDGKPYLLVADTGDNESKRSHSRIYIIEESEISRGQRAFGSRQTCQ